MALPADPAGAVRAIGLSLGGRVLGLTKLVVTVNDHLDRLDRTDVRIEVRLERLIAQVNTLVAVAAELSGQMKTIEKRLEEKDRHVATTIELEVLKASERLRAEFKRNGS